MVSNVLGSVGSWAALRAGVLLLGCSAACSSEVTSVENASTTSSDRAAVSVTTGGALSIDLPNGFVPETTAVLANGQLSIGDRSHIYGTVNGGGRAINVGSQATDLGTQAQVGDLLASGSITLHDQSYVAHDVQAGVGLTLLSGVTVAGSKHHATPLSPKVNRNWLVAFATNAAPITLNSGQSQTLAPGSYGVVTVNSGAHLTLSAGTYHFESLKLNSQGTLTLNTAAGAVIANVRTELVLRSTIQNRQSIASKVFFSYFGTALTAVETGFGGTLVAPNATIKIEGMNGTMHYGAFLGKSVSIQPDAAITHVPFSSWATLPFINDGTDPFGAVPSAVTMSSTSTENVATLVPLSPLTLDSSIPWQIVPALSGNLEFVTGGVRCAPHPGGIRVLDCMGPLPFSIRGIDSVLVRLSLSQSVHAISDAILSFFRCRIGVCPQNAVNRFINDANYDVVRSQMKFQVKGAAYDNTSDSIKSPWSNWSDDPSVFPNHSDFYLALSDAVGWLQASDRFSDFHGQPDTAMTETGNGAEGETSDNQAGRYYISYPDAWRLYVWWVAHDIAIDLTNSVPWKLSDMGNFDPDLLAPLLDSTELFHERLKHADGSIDVEIGGTAHSNYYDLPWSTHLGETIMGTPRFTFRFISQNGILQGTRYDSIKGLLDWSGNLWHFIGNDTRTTALATWGHRYYPTVEKIVNGTVRDGETTPHHWTLGCHGSTQFYKDVLRAINIPVRIPLICEHSEVEFPSEGVLMDHGDDPYNTAYTASACTADHLLLDWETFTSRFGRTVNHADAETCGSNAAPVGVQVEPDSLALCGD